MKNALFKTEKGNYYCYSYAQRMIFPCHPVLKYFIEHDGLLEKENCVQQTKSIIVDGIEYSNEVVKKYQEKYDFLKVNHMFDEIDPMKLLSSDISGDSVMNSIQECAVLTFEATERCNLRCKYCIYGDSYSTHEDRIGRDMRFEDAKTILDQMIPLWVANRNMFYRKIVIGFYGGEALLNMGFIRETVEYLKTVTKTTGLKFAYTLTTNGVNLNLFYDFLIQHDFYLVISLDGNEWNNQYRVFPNGKHSFSVVYDNIKFLQKQFPEYYQKNISFNPVLHDKNDEIDIKRYFRKEFSKTPTTSIVKATDKKDDSAFKYCPTSQMDLQIGSDLTDFKKSTLAFSLLHILRNHSNLIFSDYSELGVARQTIKRHPTGVCLPFSRKMFISAQGLLFPCERINFKYALCDINSAVNYNVNETAQFYSTVFEKSSSLCSRCYQFMDCESCFFNNAKIDGDKFQCFDFSDKEKYENTLAYYWSFFENNPTLYYEVYNNLSYE